MDNSDVGEKMCIDSSRRLNDPAGWISPRSFPVYHCSIKETVYIEKDGAGAGGGSDKPRGSH